MACWSSQRLEVAEDFVEVADLLLVDENVCVFEVHLLSFCIGAEVRREIALVELHTFDHVEGGFNTFGFFNSDGAIFTNAVHCIRDDFTDWHRPS